MNEYGTTTGMNEADPIPLSALQHRSYCPRQRGLIHLEQAFADNVHTARGRAVQLVGRGLKQRRVGDVVQAQQVSPDQLIWLGLRTPCFVACSSILNVTSKASSPLSCAPSG